MSRRKHNNKSAFQLFLDKKIKRAESLARSLGKDVLIYHDERDRISLCPVVNANRMYIPKYVLARVLHRDVKKKVRKSYA